MPRADPLHLFLLAGEASGDRIGAQLVADLRAQVPLHLTGVGGEALIAEGLTPLFAMDDLAVMGYADVILRLPLLLWRARQVARHILRTRPDAVVLVDAQVFSQTVARMIRRGGYTGPVLLYVAPSVWAWKPERAKAIRPLYDEVLCVLPFEPTVMKRLEGPRACYVGHPALARISQHERTSAGGPVLLLPGSRSGEVRKHLPLMRDVAVALRAEAPDLHFVIPVPRSQAHRIARATADWPLPVTIAEGAAAHGRAFEEARLAVAVSGTVTLELALAGIPHVITYVAEGAQVRLFEKASTPHVGLPNIIAKREVVPEVLFAGKGDARALSRATRALLASEDARSKQYGAFVALRALMQEGAPEAPLVSAASRVRHYLEG